MSGRPPAAAAASVGSAAAAPRVNVPLEQALAASTVALRSEGRSRDTVRTRGRTAHCGCMTGGDAPPVAQEQAELQSPG